MPHIARQETNTPSILALHAVDSTGHLYDPGTVEFRIMDLSTGSAVQVFPVAGWEDVTDEGRVDVGVYYAYDNATEAGWTPLVGENVGKHRIDWRFTDADDEDVTRTWSFFFDVSAVGTGLGYWSYLSPQRMRDEGISESDISNARLLQLIEQTQQMIERECRQPFRPVRFTFEWDGNSGTLWQMPVPLIGLESFKANHVTTALSTDSYRLHFYPSLEADPGFRPTGSGDPRKNPKLRLNNDIYPSIYDAGLQRLGTGRLQAGAKPHSAKGVWGFLEADGSTPKLIERAMMVVVNAMIPELEPGIPPFIVGGPVVRERTDAHEIEFGRPSSSANLTNPMAFTMEVQEILRAYRSPVGIASPATMWHGNRLP